MNNQTENNRVKARRRWKFARLVIIVNLHYQ